MKLIFRTWKECQTPGYVGLLCHHFDNKQYWTWFLQCCFFFVRRKLECTKIHNLSEIVAEFYAAPIFGCTKRYDPHPICTNLPPLINDRSLNTPHFPHFEVVSSEKLLRSHVITRCFLSTKAVEFNFSRIIMQTEYMAPNCHVSFIWIQSLSNEC